MKPLPYLQKHRVEALSGATLATSLFRRTRNLFPIYTFCTASCYPLPEEIRQLPFLLGWCLSRRSASCQIPCLNPCYLHTKNTLSKITHNNLTCGNCCEKCKIPSPFSIYPFPDNMRSTLFLTILFIQCLVTAKIQKNTHYQNHCRHNHFTIFHTC